MHDATKRFEIETLLKAGLAKARVAEIAGVSLRTVHGVRAGVEARSAETEGTDTEAGTEAPPRPPSCASDLAAMGSISVSLLEAKSGMRGGTADQGPEPRAVSQRSGLSAFSNASAGV